MEKEKVKHMISKYIIIAFIGLSSGACVAAGLFAFIVAIGVVNRIATRTKTASHIRLYETSTISGAILFNIIYLFSSSLPTNYYGLIIFGLFAGLFIGLQSMTLAEVIKTLPILAIRIKLVEGLPYVVASIALGKTIGSLFGFLYK